jgi:hypothetical protein
MQEDLALMGQPPSKDNFYAIILGSLPPSFDPYISTVNATSSVLSTLLSPGKLMLTITEEYKYCVLKQKGAKKGENAVFHAGSSNGKGQGSLLSSLKECFNCNKKGHYKADCWAPSRGKEGQGPKDKGKGKGKGKETETAAATVPKQESEDQAWIANAQTNVLDFIKEGLNYSGVANNEVVEGGASTKVLLSLIGLIAQCPTTTSADVSAAVDLADFFETPTTPSNNNKTSGCQTMTVCQTWQLPQTPQMRKTKVKMMSCQGLRHSWMMMMHAWTPSCVRFQGRGRGRGQNR